MANAIGYSGGGFISAFVTDYIRGDFGILLSFAVMSMAIALMQWLAIRSHILGMGWLWTTWLGGTLGGFVSSWASFQLAVSYGDAADFLTIYTCLRGFTTGLAQCILLRQKSQRSGWWIVTTTSSWYISVLIGSLLMANQHGYLLTMAIGAIYGLLTGIILISLFWQRLSLR